MLLKKIKSAIVNLLYAGNNDKISKYRTKANAFAQSHKINLTKTCRINTEQYTTYWVDEAARSEVLLQLMQHGKALWV